MTKTAVQRGLDPHTLRAATRLTGSCRDVGQVASVRELARTRWALLFSPPLQAVCLTRSLAADGVAGAERRQRHANHDRFRAPWMRASTQALEPTNRS